MLMEQCHQNYELEMFVLFVLQLGHYACQLNLSLRGIFVMNTHPDSLFPTHGAQIQKVRSERHKSPSLHSLMTPEIVRCVIFCDSSSSFTVMPKLVTRSHSCINYTVHCNIYDQSLGTTGHNALN